MRLDEIESRFNRIESEPLAENTHLRDNSNINHPEGIVLRGAYDKYKDLFKSVKSQGKKEDEEFCCCCGG